MTMHECPYPLCGKEVPGDKLACPTHWFMLPKRFRDAIWRAWKEPDRPNHAKVVSLAIEWYEAKAEKDAST